MLDVVVMKVIANITKKTDFEVVKSNINTEEKDFTGKITIELSKKELEHSYLS